MVIADNENELIQKLNHWKDGLANRGVKAITIKTETTIGEDFSFCHA